MKLFKYLFLISISWTQITFAGIPTINSITETSAPAATTPILLTPYYELGETINFTVVFNEAVDITSTPELQFRIRGNLEEAIYSAGTGTDTIVFQYTLPVGINDWNGITLEKFKINGTDAIKSVATTEDLLDVDFANIPIAGMKVDTADPNFNTLTQTATGGILSGGSTYLNAGDTISSTINLVSNDTRSAASIDFNIGGTTKTLNFTGNSSNGESNSSTKTTPAAFLNGENGPITITDISWKDQAEKSIINIPAFPVATNFIVDTTLPIVSEVTAVTPAFMTDSTPDYTFNTNEAGAITYGGGCSSSTVNAVSGNNTVTFNALPDGTYNCTITVTDIAGNNSLVLSMSPFTVDTTAPVFSNIGVVSDNIFDPTYGNASSTLTFTLTLTNPDSFNGTGQIDFHIGGTARIINFAPADSSNNGTYTINYPLAGENGNITIDNIIFNDFAGNAIDLTTFVGGNAPTPTVTIDTTLPGLSSTTFTTSNTNPLWAKNGDTITYTLGFNENVKLKTLNAASTANNASTLTTEFDLPAFGNSDVPSFGNSDVIVFTINNGDNGLITLSSANFDITDRAGNATTITQADINALFANTITADTTKPIISAARIISNNIFDTALAKTNDTITINFTTSDNLSPTVGLFPGGKILNKPITASTLGAVGAGKSVERFTDGTEVSEQVVGFSFQIQDEAGNISLAKTTTDDASSVRFDRTNPTVTSAIITATSSDGSASLNDVPTYYAKVGDLVELEFVTADYVDILGTPTGTINGQVATVVSTGVDHWKASITTNAAAPEGTIPFDIIIYDNAGNGAGGGAPQNPIVHLTGTTNGSSVIFDKTEPTLPTTIFDGKGAETSNFKHRINAHFNWVGDTDNLAGIFHYEVLFDNPTNGTNQTATVFAPTRNFTPNIPLPNDDPYRFHVEVIDKAGNKNSGEKVYLQRYTIGVIGKIVSSTGTPLSGVIVQVVARHGDLCNAPEFVCSAISDSNGDYDIVTQKDRNYTINAWDKNHYLEKAQIHVAQIDTTKNFQLNPVLNSQETQTGNEILMITTDLFFQKTGETEQITRIFVSSWGGDAKVLQNGTNMLITSLSSITSVTTNNPDIQIVKIADNKYEVINAGKIVGKTATDIATTNFSVGKGFGSSDSRLGVKKVTNSGVGSTRWAGMNRDEFVGKGDFWTEEVSKDFTKRYNAGKKGYVKGYVNRNGYTVFGGYVPGKIAVDRYPHRFQNQVVYRDKKVKKHRNRHSIAKKQKAMKKAFQHPEKVKLKSTFHAGIGRGNMNIDASKTAISGKIYRKHYVNKFTKTENRTLTHSRIRKNSLDNIYMRVGGKSITMSELQRGTRIHRGHQTP